MNSLKKNNKSKSFLINQVKINNKSLEILDSFISNKNIKNKSNTSRNNKFTNIMSNKRFTFTNLKSVNNTSTVNSEKYLQTNHNNIFNNSKAISLTERNNNNLLQILIKNNNKYKSRNTYSLQSEENTFPYLSLSQQNFKYFYTININKYKKIFESVSSRIKSSYKKKKFLLNKNIFNNFINNKNANNIKGKHFSPLKKKKRGSKKSIKSIHSNSDKYLSLPKLEDYQNTLENEFNCRELIKIDNGKIKQKLKQYKYEIYKKSPIYKTNEKLNKLLIREFNINKSDFKNAFNKKYKIYRQSVNKIQEIKKKNIYRDFKKMNQYEQKLFNKNKEIMDYNNDYNNNYKKQKITNKNVKKALNNYYSQKAKNILKKKLEMEKELIDLKTKFKDNIEEEKYKKNEYNINYAQLNQIIQTKLLYREIYETDINKKKKEFYDEHTKMLHKIRNWSIPTKIVKQILKQKTINKFKINSGAYFGTSQ